VDASCLGIDFGTSSTVAALAGPDGRVRPLLFDSSPLLPSNVFIGPDGEPLTGADAERAGLAHPSGLEPNPKRRIDDGTVWLGEREIAVVDLVAAVLRRVAGEAVRVSGGLPGRVVLTHPAAWGPARLRILAEAAARAGLGRPEFVPEPVAAAAYFAKVLGQQIPPDRTLVVYDLGAGTFDVSVVRPDAGGFQVIASAGLPDVGGLDLDAAVVAHARAATGSATEAWSRLDWPQTPADLQARYVLWRGAKAAKEQLSRHPVTDLHVPLVAVDTHLTSEEFAKLSTPLLERTAALTLSVLRDAKVAPERIGGIFLVGGSSRIPLAATLLHRTLRIAPTALDHPELVVAEGSLQAVAAPPSFPPPPGPTGPPPPTVPFSPPGPTGPFSPPGPAVGDRPTVRLAGGRPPAGKPAVQAGRTPSARDGLRKHWKLAAGVVATVVVLAFVVGLVALKPWAEKPITGARYLTTLTAHTGYVNGVGFTSDGRLLATASADKTIRFWGADDRKPSGLPLRSFTLPITGVAMSPDGKRLASVAYDEVRLWDIAGRKAATDPLSGTTHQVRGIGYSSDGKTLRGVDSEGTILTWKVPSAKLDGSRKLAIPSTSGGSTPSVTTAVFSPNGKVLAVIQLGDVRLYDVATGKPIGVPLKNETESPTTFRAIAFSPDSSTLAGGGSNSKYGVVLWDVATRRPLGADLEGHTSLITSLAFSSDGKTLASGSADETVRLWDVAGRQAIGGPLKGHTSAVDDLAFSPDDNLLASGSEDKTARVWRLEH
jgi:WD40 repeat protein